MGCTNTESTQTEYTISRKNVIRLILEIMPGDKAETMLKMFGYDDIIRLFTKPETLENTIRDITSTMNEYGKIKDALLQIPSLMENRNELLQKCAMNHYHELSQKNKQDFCVEIMNQKEFQKDLRNAMFDEMGRPVPSMKPLFEALENKKTYYPYMLMSDFANKATKSNQTATSLSCLNWGHMV